MKSVRVALAALLSAPLVVLAAQDGELWEVTTQMDMAGLPAGMGAQTMRVCQEKDPKKQVPPAAQQENCKVSDLKQSGNRMSMTVTCPDSKAYIEQTYNSAHTEYKGKMRMTSSQGDMTMTMAGRKVGSCDATAERKKREAMIAGVQRQQDEAQQTLRKAYDQQVAQCAEAVQTMQYAKLGTYGQCKQHPELCKAMAADPEQKRVLSSCSARQAEYCKRYRTEDGFLKARADPQGAEACGLSVTQVKAELCPAAGKKESLAFLASYCPAEAKPLAEKHCAGRDFTALRAGGGKGDKYDEFCMAYLSKASLAADSADESPRQGDSQVPDPAKAITEGVSEGINKLRGLFGR